MARVKCPAVRDPDDLHPSRRRSNRRQAVVKPPKNQGPSETVELDDDSQPPSDPPPLDQNHENSIQSTTTDVVDTSKPNDGEDDSVANVKNPKGKLINFRKIILQSLRGDATNTRGKMYFPSMITQLLIQRGVPQYTDDQIVRASSGTWQIDLKAVSRLRDKKERTDQDVHTMLQNLMNTKEQQQKDFLEKIDTLKADMAAKLKEEGQKLREELKETDPARKHSLKIRSLGLKIRRLEREKTKLQEENMALKEKLETHATDAAAVPQHATQPTLKEYDRFHSSDLCCSMAAT